MSQLNSDGWAPKMQGILRIVAGFLFMQHGLQKVFGLLGKPAASGTQMIIGGYLELIGGVLLIIGLFTRPVAFVLSGMMAVAYFQAHSPRGFWPVMNGGELAALYCFVFLFFAVAGGGPWSLDAMMRKRRS